MGASCSDNRTDSERNVDEFLYTLRAKPNLMKYRGNTQNCDMFNRAWASGQFGGVVFTSVGAKYADGKSYKVTSRNRNNTLLDQILRLSLIHRIMSLHTQPKSAESKKWPEMSSKDKTWRS